MTTHDSPPRIPRQLLEGALPEGPTRDGLVGDLHELWVERRDRRGRLRADAWYWWEACSAALRLRLAHRASAGGAATEGTGRERRGRLAHVWTQVRSELRPAIRRLLRRPGFAAAAIVPLAIGIGAAATIFTLVHDVVLAPLPYPDSDRLVVVRHLLPGYEVDGRVPEVGSFLGQYLHYRERSRLLDEVGAYWTFDATLTDEGRAEYLRVGGATPGLWRALGVRAVEGRTFRDDDGWPGGGGRGVTLLSHGFWTERYGGAPSAVGSTVTQMGWTYETVGVLPPSLPLAESRPVLWNAIPDVQARDNPEWTADLVGRLAPGATAEALQRELAALVEELPERYGEGTIRNTVERGRMTPLVMPLRDWVLGDMGRAVWLLFGSALLLLLVALANVGGLFLVRADAARRELAVRLALGSGRLGLVVRFVADAALVVGGAALLGLGLAHVGVGGMSGAVPAEIPRIERVAVGWDEAGFVLVVSLLVVGALTVLQLLHGRGRLTGALHEGDRGAGAGSTHLRLRHAFVSLQVALALVLLVGGGLLFRSARSLGGVDPGFPVEGVLTFRVPFPFSEIQAAGAPGTTATPFYEELTRRLEALPGVVGVGWGSCSPLSDLCDSGGFAIASPEIEEAGEDPASSATFASPGFRATLGIPLLQGRDLRPEDHQEGTNRVLVSESLARRLWPDRSPLGRTLTPVAFFQATDPEPFTVVGVVGDVRFDNLRRETRSMVYMPVLVPDRPTDISTASFVVRASVPPMSLLDDVRQTVADLRPDIPVAFAETTEAAFARETAPARFASLLLMLAAGATVLLSALGVYGVVAYAVGLRRSEFGIRLALGAEGRQLRRMVLWRGLLTAAAGVAAGLVGAVAASGLARSLVFGVEPTDPATYALAAGVLVLVAVVATWLPARRASRVEPSEALRAG